MGTIDLESYAAIGVVILLVVIIAGSMIALAHVIGPKPRRGPVKDSPYESGVPPVADTHRRFNVRFYIVAVLFLLFDVEVVFLWPWAQVFHESATANAAFALDGGIEVGKGFIAAAMGFFVALLIFGLVYEWKKGVFQWD